MRRRSSAAALRLRTGGIRSLDIGADAGTPDSGVTITAPNAQGWQFASAGFPAGKVLGASMDEAGNLWVAGASAGLFVSQNGGAFRGLTLAGGLHPYGCLAGQIARDYGVADGSPADPGPSLDATPVISVAGGPAGTAFVGHQGRSGCEDEWTQRAPAPTASLRCTRAAPAARTSGIAPARRSPSTSGQTRRLQERRRGQGDARRPRLGRGLGYPGERGDAAADPRRLPRRGGGLYGGP